MIGDMMTQQDAETGTGKANISLFDHDI